MNIDYKLMKREKYTNWTREQMLHVVSLLKHGVSLYSLASKIKASRPALIVAVQQFQQCEEIQQQTIITPAIVSQDEIGIANLLDESPWYDQHRVINPTSESNI